VSPLGPARSQPGQVVVVLVCRATGEGHSRPVPSGDPSPAWRRRILGWALRGVGARAFGQQADFTSAPTGSPTRWAGP